MAQLLIQYCEYFCGYHFGIIKINNYSETVRLNDVLIDILFPADKEKDICERTSDKDFEERENQLHLCLMPQRKPRRMIIIFLCHSLRIP